MRPVNSLFGVKIFGAFPSFTFFSSPSSGGISHRSADSFLSVDSSLSIYSLLTVDSSSFSDQTL